MGRRANGSKPDHDFESSLFVVHRGIAVLIGKHINGNVGVDVVGCEGRRFACRRVVIAHDIFPLKVDVELLDRAELLGENLFELDVGESVHVVLSGGSRRVLPGDLERGGQFRFGIAAVVVEENLTRAVLAFVLCKAS